MTVTEYGYCPHCDVRRVELVPTATGPLECSKCGALDVYSTKEDYEELQESRH